MTTENDFQPPAKEYKYPEIEEQFMEVQEPPLIYVTQRYTYADYLTWADDKMREIIDGFVYFFSAPLRRHAKAVSSFIIKSGSYIHKRKGKCEIYTAPFDVRLPMNGEIADDKIYNVVQPDICVVCDPAKLDDRGCIGAPDLIAEVVSPSTSKRDMNEKFFLYEKVGVSEYWIIHPENKEVTVFILQSDGKYNAGTTYKLGQGTNKIPVKTLEGLMIDLKELFAE